MFPAPVCGSESPHWQSSVNLNCDSRFLKRIGKSAARRCLKTRRHRHVKALCSGTCSANQVVYRGYDLEVRRAASGWQVGISPRSADLPILSRCEILASDPDEAVVMAKGRVDRANS